MLKRILARSKERLTLLRGEIDSAGRLPRGVHICLLAVSFGIGRPAVAGPGSPGHPTPFTQVNPLAQRVAAPRRENRVSVVIIVVADRLLPEDLTSAASPSLARALSTASLAVMSDRASALEGVTAGYGSIGAGAGIEGAGVQPPASVAGLPATARALMLANQQAHTSALPGALGACIRAAGGYTALVGSESERTISVPGALIAMDPLGQLSFDYSDAGDAVAPSWPWQRRAVPHELSRVVLGIITHNPARAGLIVVEDGDTDRADDWVWIGTPTRAQVERAREFWAPRVLDHLGELIGRLQLIAARQRCLLCLVSPMSRRSTQDGGPIPGLTPFAIWGPGYSPGRLYSPSTRRRGLILGQDLAPTILHAMGLEPPPGMTGQVVHTAGRRHRILPLNEDEIESAFALDARSRADYRYEMWGLILYGIMAGLAIIGPTIIPERHMSSAVARVAQLLILAAFSGPAALVIPMGIDLPGSIGPAILAFCLWVALALLSFRPRASIWRVALACSWPLAVLLLDGITRGQLFRDALWGRMPIAGGRLYGVDNTCMGVLIGAGWVVAGACASALGSRRAGAFLALMLMLFSLAVVGLPTLGANFGGGIAAASALGYFAARLVGARPAIAGCAAAVAAAIVAFVCVAIDVTHLLGPASHLALSWTDLLHRPGSARDLIARKVWQNLALTRWVFLGGVVPVFQLARWITMRRRDIASRIGVAPVLNYALEALVAGMVGAFVFNDTGIISVVFMLLYYAGTLVFFALDGYTHRSAALTVTPGAC